MQFENILMLMKNIGLPNISSQLQNIGIQMLNMGIQILNISTESNMGIGMNNIIQQLQNIGMNIENIAMKLNTKNGMFNMNMNIPMPNNIQINQNMMNMMNLMNNNMNTNFNQNPLDNHIEYFDDKCWDLLFELDNKVYSITISNQKTVGEAINLFKRKANLKENDKFRFIFNSNIINPQLKIYELSHRAKIKVIRSHEVIGG